MSEAKSTYRIKLGQVKKLKETVFQDLQEIQDLVSYCYDPDVLENVRLNLQGFRKALERRTDEAVKNESAVFSSLITQEEEEAKDPTLRFAGGTIH